MKKSNVFVLTLLVFLPFITIFGQKPSANSSPEEVTKEIERMRERQKEHDLKHGKDENGMIKQPAEKPPEPTAEVKEMIARRAATSAEKREALKEAELRLQVPSHYQQKYAAFLDNKKTGMARLFVDKGCGIGKTASAQDLEKCSDVIPVRGGGAFYSFRYRSNHFYGVSDGWDMYLYKGTKFLVGNDSVQAIISEVGNVDLENLTLKSKAFDFLEDYEPVSTFAEIKEKSKILRNGISANGYTYSNMANVSLDSTYVFRTVAYKRGKSSSNGTDLTIGFKVVGIEPDGSVIILWKQFKDELPRRELL